MDKDGSTEFMIMNDNGTAINLLIVDFNDGLTTKFNVSIINPLSITTGNFGGDASLDIAVFGQYSIVILDVQSGSLLGNYSIAVGDWYSAYSVGYFLETSQDSIAVGIWPASNIARMDIVAGNGSVMRSITLHNQVFGLASFEYGAGLDEVAVSITDGNLTVIAPSTMTSVFNLTGLPEQSYVLPGVLNNDNQEDLVVVSTMSNYSIFIDGSNGSIIRQGNRLANLAQSPISGNPPSPVVSSGYMDADNLTDYTVLSYPGNKPSFLRGSDGTIGYEESRIPDKSSQILVFDINGNSRDDIIVLNGLTAYIVLSDTQGPQVIPEPLSPLHPTIQDPYIKIEVEVVEQLDVIAADLYIRYDGGNWSRPTENLQVSGNRYFAFLVGKPEGFYEYYLVFQDTYFNIGTLGNETNPMNFTVAGHLSWFDTKYQSTGLNHRLMSIGNSSDGREVIYTLDSNSGNIILERYSTRGENQTLAIFPFGNYSDFSIYTGLMDGDNILDPILLLYSATTYDVNVSIYHGNSGSLWFTTQYPYRNTFQPESAQVFDIDNDGIDEFFFVAENSTYNGEFLIRLRADGSWSRTEISAVGAESYGLSIAKTINDHSVEAVVSASTGYVEIFNATSMSVISTHNVTRSDHASTMAISVYVLNNRSESYSKFLVYLRFTDASGVSSGFQIFDASVPSINETVIYGNTDGYYYAPILIDVDDDGIDEVFGVNRITNELTLFRLTAPATIDWTIPGSTSDFLSSLAVDFDGDGQDEIGVFTRQDENLTIVSLDGTVERTLPVGQVYGSMQLSSVDLGYGEEIAAYPLIQDGVTKIAVIRDIVQIRRLNVSLTYAPSDLLQGDTLTVDVDVTNIYAEPINDAEVYLTIHYLSGGSIINQTKGLIFGTSNYSTSVAVNWPIGIVNLSVSVRHPLYDQWEEYYPGALTIRSVLDVLVYTRDIVVQNSTFSANITVADSLGSRVSDAEVLVTLGGVDYTAPYVGSQYRVSISNIGLSPGEYTVNTTVNHPYAFGISSAVANFGLETDKLVVSQGIPALVEQDDVFEGWVNITDAFNSPLENAQVTLVGSEMEFGLIEVEPGAYYLDSLMTLSVGNHSFTIIVEHGFVQGTEFGQVQIIVMGNLIPVIAEVPPVDGGGVFSVSVFISDGYGTMPSDTWVLIEIDGRNVTAIHESGTKFTAELNATYPAGMWNFTVYYGSVFSRARKMTNSIFVYSNPVVETLYSDGEWEVMQGNDTIIEVQVRDWQGTLMKNASVTLFIRGITYTLGYVTEGVYQAEVSTVGWPYGIHTYYLTVGGEYLYQNQYSGNLTVIARPTIIIRPSTTTPEQLSTLSITVDVKDLYDNPITGLHLEVTFQDVTKIAEETSVKGTYEVEFTVEGVGHGSREIVVGLEGSLTYPKNTSMTVTVMVAVPRLDLSPMQIYTAAGLSFLISLIGVLLFIKISSTILSSPRKVEDVTRSVTYLDRTYLVIVAASGALVVHSWLLYLNGSYVYALLESVILLGASVLLYGLWLYRDAYASILVSGDINRKRTALGMWHLVLVPFIVLLIFEYGRYIEIFAWNILENVTPFVIGNVVIVPMLMTILTTYLSSIVVVVVSFYWEIQKGLRRIEDMKNSGTPGNVITDEQVLLIGRTGASIRIKFLMFLLVLGAITVMQLEFLRSYSMVAIVLLPILFLVLIPFISTRIIKGLPHAYRRIQRTREGGFDAEETYEPDELIMDT